MHKDKRYGLPKVVRTFLLVTEGRCRRHRLQKLF